MVDAMQLAPAVLVIEDENTQRHLLIKKLEKLGFRVFGADNGRAGLEMWLAGQNEIRIVITDLQMPECDGLTVLKEIRRHEGRYTYIMVLTTSDAKDTLVEGLRLGADDFVHKPVVTEELELRMQGALRLLRLQDYRALVGAMVELAAERAGETITHLQRTRMYCKVVAEDLRQYLPELGLTEQLVEEIGELSVLHDIGKNGLPDGLLNRRGRCTPREYEIIKDHARIGGDMLKRLYEQNGSAYLQLGHDIAIAHHERWDGTGYPYGLKGDAIPLAARILAFAETYDGLRSRRPYKDAMSLDHAEIHLYGEAGKQFDPRIVESYRRNREKFMEIHDSIADTAPTW
jgi:putative two-component system response regulator